MLLPQPEDETNRVGAEATRKTPPESPSPHWPLAADVDKPQAGEVPRFGRS